ncbi:hypothetical protein [uncultured Gammaproteobacteria bacterium]|nr:hypothetical protein [uncultured Gammaproteobacteria bacterium]CAC9644987.1 hypothetical protein [uncultured Gammaproteobacteria bacterium]CAC9655463.1 hypothetical protein [uncultured Gammaproteobacteria bacterium]CAC9659076.1 hypothetical protein [uncultured Gammaproteobacteria bacterium]VVH51387.1 hypothetical protein BPUTSESOX_946 [uncultured Gammaproteobacteria bacterium]
MSKRQFLENFIPLLFLLSIYFCKSLIENAFSFLCKKFINCKHKNHFYGFLLIC